LTQKNGQQTIYCRLFSKPLLTSASIAY